MGHLYVIRHGETSCNAQAILQGPRVDDGLSEAGARQAQALGEAFGETPLGALYVSPLRRARETAQALITFHAGRVAPQVVPELYEMDYGDFCGHSLHEVGGAVQDIQRAWSAGHVAQAFPGGESPVLAQHRVRFFADRMRALAGEGGDVAVVGHGHINRILVATLTAAPLSQLESFPQSNAAITHLEVTADGVALRRLNDTSHLAWGAAVVG